MEVLQEYKAQGIIRAIGLGVRTHKFHRQCIEAGLIDVSLTFRDYHLLGQSAEDGVLAVAAAHGVGVLNGSPTLNGLLGGGDPLEFVREVEKTGQRWMRIEDDRVQHVRALLRP